MRIYYTILDYLKRLHLYYIMLY